MVYSSKTRRKSIKCIHLGDPWACRSKLRSEFEQQACIQRKIDLNLNKIEGFENIKETLGTARETIARVVEVAYPTWEKELDRVGLRKIFDKHGNCFWVSQWYYDNCEKVIDPDTSKPMYKTQKGYNVEGQGESAAGSAMNAVRARIRTTKIDEVVVPSVTG